MINQFHPDSQIEMIKDIENVVCEERDIISAAEAGKEALAHFEKMLRLEGKERSAYLRKNALRAISKWRRIINNYRGNHWYVYELCKAVYDLAEIDRVDYNGADFETKYDFIRKLVPFTHQETIHEGVSEYHHSRIRTDWKMQWMIDEEKKIKTELKDEALQLTQDIFISFIQEKGLTAEFQAFVANYEISHDQATR